VSIFTKRYTTEILAIAILCVILLYLPSKTKLLLKRAFLDLFSKSHYPADTCENHKFIKFIHTFRGELWLYKDSPCLTISQNSILLYQNQLIGITIQKENDYSTILPVYNKDMKLKVKLITKEGKTVTGIYQGAENKLGKVYFIPAFFDISHNEKVFTILDEKSKIPENLFIGTVQEKIIEPNQTYTLIIDTQIDINLIQISKIKPLQF
jgi:hypothetical protein